jgi:hypothetical protein
MERRKKLWMDGFRAGQELVSRCPHPPGSPDARDWLEGWAVGLHGAGGAAREARAGGRWRGWVRRWWER